MKNYFVQNQIILLTLTVSCVMVDTLHQNDRFCSELLLVEGAVSANGASYMS